jgi:hypothetical protein
MCVYISQMPVHPMGTYTHTHIIYVWGSPPTPTLDTCVHIICTHLPLMSLSARRDWLTPRRDQMIGVCVYQPYVCTCMIDPHPHTYLPVSWFRSSRALQLRVPGTRGRAPTPVLPIWDTRTQEGIDQWNLRPAKRVGRRWMEDEVENPLCRMRLSIRRGDPTLKGFTPLCVTRRCLHLRSSSAQIHICVCVTCIPLGVTHTHICMMYVPLEET